MPTIHEIDYLPGRGSMYAARAGTFPRLVRHAVCVLAQLAFCIPLIAGDSVPQGGAKEKTDVVIDASVVNQQIDGFGTSTVTGFKGFERGHFDQVVPPGVSYKMDEKLQRLIITTLVGELGVTHVRFWLQPAGIEQTNDNDDPEVMEWKAFTWAGDSNRAQSDNFLLNRRNGIVELGEFLKIAVPLGLENWILTPGGLPDWLMQRMKEDEK